MLFLRSIAIVLGQNTLCWPAEVLPFKLPREGQESLEFDPGIIACVSWIQDLANVQVGLKRNLEFWRFRVSDFANLVPPFLYKPCDVLGLQINYFSNEIDCDFVIWQFR